MVPMRIASLFIIFLTLAMPATAQEGFTLGLENLALPVDEPSQSGRIETGAAGDLEVKVEEHSREALVYRSALTPRSPKEFTLAMWDAPMARLYYSRAEAEAMLGREGLVHGGRMMGFGMATSAIGDQSQSSLGFLASGGSWSELTLGEKFAAGAEASFLAAILYGLAQFAD